MTSSPRPDEAGRPGARPDSTDPDLAPLPPMTDTGRMPAYEDEPAAVATEAGPDDVGPGPASGVDGGISGDHEIEETGLITARQPGTEAVAARLGRSPRDMVLSIGVLLVVVFGAFGLYQWVGGGDDSADPASAYAQARDAKAFPVLEVGDLGSGWRAVNATYQSQSGGGVLRLGFETPGDGTLQLIESNIATDVLIARELGDDARGTGKEFTVAGKRWAEYEARGDERALVVQEAQRTVIVIGTAGQAEMEKLINSLT